MKKNIFLSAILIMTMITFSASGTNKSNPFNGYLNPTISDSENLMYTYHIAYCSSPSYPTLSIHVDYNSPWDYNYAFGVDGNIGYIFDTLSGSFTPGESGITINSTLTVTYWNSTSSGYIEVAPGFYPYAF